MKHSKIFLRTAVVYIRTSSKDTPCLYSNQENSINEYALRHGYRILQVFRDDNSYANTFERKGFREMMEYIRVNKWKVKHLIVIDRTRLSTNPVNLKRLGVFLKRNGVRIVSVAQSVLQEVLEHAKRHL